MNSFLVQTEAYQGPLDLLLELIEKRKLFISDVSLAKVTDDYISYIQSGSNKSLSHDAHFILVAATLLLIKSRSLLPELTLTQEETSDVAELERRLKILAAYKEAAVSLASIFGTSPAYEAQYIPQQIQVFAPHASITIDRLRAELDGIISRIPKKESLPEVAVEKVISLEEMIDKLSKRIADCVSMSFKQFSGMNGKDTTTKEERVHVIVSFLAMLELVRHGAIEVKQEGQFDDIQIETQKVDTPRY